MNDKIVNISFNIWANDESEALELQKQIFDMIEENPQISTSEIAAKLGVGVRTVKRRIKQMTNIVYVGSGYSGHWEIKGE